jgi:hypothetical protein
LERAIYRLEGPDTSELSSAGDLEKDKDHAMENGKEE